MSDQPPPSQNQQRQKWFPLESNPTLMNQYIATLGWDTSQYHLVDVFSTEEWALEMIPQPVAAVLLLYPLTAVQLKYEQQEAAALRPAPVTNENGGAEDDVWFIKQRIGNACGTIGLLHAMMNAVHHQQPQQSSSTSTTGTTATPLIRPNSWLEEFWTSTRPTATTDPRQRAERLEQDPHIATLHDQATSSRDNQTSRGETVDDDIITHFIAFVSGCHNVGTGGSATTTEASPSVLYELDGRKGQPIRHGTTAGNNATLLPDACRIIQEQFMARDPQELRFTILALAPHTDPDE